MSNQPIITVVIPTHNRCNFLKEAIDSVSKQTFGNWELIVVDDVSEDETWSWLSQLDDPRVRKIRLKQHAERSKARNIGLQTANGQFILFLDDDDLLPEGALQTHLEALEKYPTAIASVGSYTMFDKNGSRQEVRILKRRTLRYIRDDVLFGWVAVSGQCLFQTQILKSVGGWDESRTSCEDHDLLLRIGHLGPFALQPEHVLLWRLHSGQYRPHMIEEIMTEVREQAVKQMHGEERESGEHILRVRALAQTAFNYYQRAKTVKALILYFKMFFLPACGAGGQTAPRLLQSPLIRPLVLAPMMKCFAGNIGLQIGRRIFSFVRQLRKRKVQISHRIVNSDGRLDGTPK